MRERDKDTGFITDEGFGTEIDDDTVNSRDGPVREKRKTRQRPDGDVDNPAQTQRNNTRDPENKKDRFRRSQREKAKERRKQAETQEHQEYQETQGYQNIQNRQEFQVHRNESVYEEHKEHQHEETGKRRHPDNRVSDREFTYPEDSVSQKTKSLEVQSGAITPKTSVQNEVSTLKKRPNIQREAEKSTPDTVPPKPQKGSSSLERWYIEPEDTSRKNRLISGAESTLVNTAVVSVHKALDVISKANGERDDNAGTDALKTAENTGETVTRLSFRTAEQTVRNTQKAAQNSGKTADFVAENTFGNTKKAISREEAKLNSFRKRQRQRRLLQSMKAKRAARAGKEAARGAKKTVSVGKFMIDTIFHGWKVFAGIIIFVILIMIFGGQGAMSVLPTTVEALSMEKAASYQSTSRNIDAADLSLSYMELMLRDKIDGLEEEYPDFDEYTYTLGTIGHDPFTLINYLSAQYGVIEEEALAEVTEIFKAMYELKLTETEDVRVRLVPKPPDEDEDEEEEEGGDDEDGEDDSGETGDSSDGDAGDSEGDGGDEEDDDDDGPVMIEEEYTVKILKVELITHSLGDIVTSRLSGSSEKMAMYQLYTSTHGLRQILGSPVNSSWSVKDYYGYRRNPVTDEDERHMGLDIAVSDGTQVISSIPGTVTDIGISTSFGNYVTISHESGFTVSYAHLNSVIVSMGQEVTIGEPVGTSGGAGSEEGSCLHMEFLYEGEYFNPLFYTKNGG